VTGAHDKAVTHHYTVHYPDHAPRKDDPHYVDFEAFRRRTKKEATCTIGERRGDFSECSLDKPMELHHAHIEFAVANAVDLRWLSVDYPGVDNPDEVGAWIETAANLQWLCVFHHRGRGGVHVTSASDYEAERYVRGLIT
jgi:hypothetical protein